MMPDCGGRRVTEETQSKDASRRYEPCEACRATGEWADSHRCPSCGGAGEVSIKKDALRSERWACPNCGRKTCNRCRNSASTDGLVLVPKAMTGKDASRRDVAIGYTLATGRLFCPVAEFHAWAEKQLSRPIFTHEFGMHDTWDELRESFEHDAKRALDV